MEKSLESTFSCLNIEISCIHVHRMQCVSPIMTYVTGINVVNKVGEARNDQWLLADFSMLEILVIVGL
jgi:hypothetical protein